MNNYIRACFCTDNLFTIDDLEEIQLILQAHSCIPFGLPLINLAKWVEQKFIWKINNEAFEIKIFQYISGKESSASFTFDIIDRVFLSGSNLSYYPHNDIVFTAYKNILVDILRKVHPVIGIIDWDADLQCSNSLNISYANWGNYLSNHVLNCWEPRDRGLIPELVDECLYIDDIGLLTFNHPLGIEDYSLKHKQFWNLINQNIRYLK